MITLLSLLFSNRNLSSQAITNMARSQLGGDDGGCSNKLKLYTFLALNNLLEGFQLQYSINPKTAAYNKSKISRAAKELTQT